MGAWPLLQKFSAEFERAVLAPGRKHCRWPTPPAARAHSHAHGRHRAAAQWDREYGILTTLSNPHAKKGGNELVTPVASNTV